MAARAWYFPLQGQLPEPTEDWDRLGNNPYKMCFQTANWDTRDLIRHGFGNGPNTLCASKNGHLW